MEGPTKEIKGGKYADTLLKYGKTATIEIQDALGKAEALDALCGGLAQWLEDSSATPSMTYNGLHFGQDFAPDVTILGESFFIDKESGQQVPVNIIIYKMTPDSLFNLTQDAEGDASVFDMNGTLNVQELLVPNASGSTVTHGLYYSILPKAD